MKNVSKEDVLELVKDFPLVPRYSQVIITLNNLQEDGQLVYSNNVLSDVQYVVAKGSMVNDLQVGDKVLINLEKMKVPVKVDTGVSVDTVMQVAVDTVEVEDNTFAFIDDRLIKSIDNRKEEVIKI